MCGICGIVDYTGRPIDAMTVDTLRDAMVRRGPDGAGTEILPFVALGHRRLSIIDLSCNARQPMSNEDGSIWLVFNGEIYNFEGLREELKAHGHRFESASDSDVLVHGYEEWGITGLAERISGMFAFALWDARSRELHLVRDRLGKKPLYYGWVNGQFVFASELKAIWAISEGHLRVRPESIARFLYWSYLPGRETIYDGIFQLLPARILTLATSGLREQRYWRLSFADKIRAPMADLVDQTDALVTAAVRRRMRSDVPLGAFLSGGVDSSYVVSRMVGTIGSKPIRTFAMGTSDRSHDERAYARQVAAHCHTDHTEFEVTPDAWSLLPRMMWEFGQPFADPACLPTYYVAERARQYVTVALTGDGGDEAFAGYSQHRGRYLGAALRPFIPTALLDGVLRQTTGLMDDGGTSRLASAARFLRYIHSAPLVNWGGSSAWALHHLEPLWRAPFRDCAAPRAVLDFALEADADFDGTSALDRALHHDFNVLLPFCYNVKLDVATMMNSLEARSPFQDRELVEWAARVPAEIKMRPRQTKALLKRAATRWLPQDVIYRPKQGFSLPIDDWFRGPWAPAARALIFSEQARDRGYFDYDYLDRLWVAHASGTASHGQRFWELLCLETWLQLFVDGTLAPPQSEPLISEAIH